MVTQLWPYGGPGQPYGSFAGKAPGGGKSYTATFTRHGVYGGPAILYGNFAGKSGEGFELGAPIEVTTISGALSVSGAIGYDLGLSQSGAVAVAGALSVSGSLELAIALSQSGAVAVSGSLSVTGELGVGIGLEGGAVAAAGALSIAGDFTIEADAQPFTLAQSGAMAITGTVTAAGDVRFNEVVATGAGRPKKRSQRTRYVAEFKGEEYEFASYEALEAFVEEKRKVEQKKPRKERKAVRIELAPAYVEEVAEYVAPPKLTYTTPPLVALEQIKKLEARMRRIQDEEEEDDEVLLWLM